MLRWLENRKFIGGVIFLSLITFIFKLIIKILYLPFGEEINHFFYENRSIEELYFNVLLIVGILLIYFIPLFFLTTFEENKQIGISKKLLRISLGIILSGIVGTILISWFIFGWNEIGSIAIFPILFGLPILTLIYLIAIIFGVIGFFNAEERGYMRSHKSLFLLLSVVYFWELFTQLFYFFTESLKIYS